MAAGADRDEHHQAQVQLVAVEDRHAPLDHPGVGQPLHPLPARRLRQARPLGQLGDRHRGVGLQLAQDPAVDRVENDSHAIPLVWRTKFYKVKRRRAIDAG
jgi:hypothetical protein